MLVKCIRDYHDLQLKRLVKTGEEFEVTDDRAKVLVKAAVATPTTKVVMETADKKPVVKKKTTAKKQEG